MGSRRAASRPAVKQVATLPPLEAFRSSTLMAGVPGRTIAQIYSRFSRREFESGSTVFRQGEPVLLYHLVLEGLAKGVQSSREGAEAILHIHGPGDLIGALPTLGHATYPASAVALTPLSVLAVEARDFEQVLRDHPQVAVNLLKAAADILQEVHARLREAGTLPVEQRIARTLCRLMRRCGEPCREGIALDLPLTRRDLSSICGTTMYTVSRTLKAWERQGWLQSRRGRLTVLDPLALEGLSAD